jgi:hypothetical protein
VIKGNLLKHNEMIYFTAPTDGCAAKDRGVIGLIKILSVCSQTGWQVLLQLARDTQLSGAYKKHNRH